MDLTAKIEYLKTHISMYPDFPKPGILFRDFFSLLRQPKAFALLRDVMLEYIKKYCPNTDVVVGLESRGFLLGSVLALDLGVPFVPIRKPGKLPGELRKVSYQLEYGSDTFEMQKEGISPGQNVLIVDDLLATGGSMGAACQLVEDSQAKVTGCLVVMELDALNGRKNISHPVHSIMHF